MSKMTREEAARREGISYALRVARKGGVEALEEDVRQRGITDCPVGLGKPDMEEFVQNVKANVLDTVLIMSAAVLQDEFDFGRIQIGRFIERFNKKAEVLEGGYATWDDFREQLRDELRIDLSIRENQRNVTVKAKVK